MAFGLNPKYSTNLTFENVSENNFLVLAIDAANKLNWNVSHVTTTGFTAYRRFTGRSAGEEIDISILAGNATVESRCLGNQMFDWGINKKNVESFVAAFNELLSTVTDQELADKWQQLQPDIQEQKEKVFKQSDVIKGSFLNLFKPVKGYFITPILIDINIAVFILMVVAGANIMLPDNHILLAWGANFRPYTLNGEWWRLLTNFFIHIGILHILLNMYALLYIGLLLEPRLGSERFIAAYLLTGIAASVNSLYWHENTISAGASGAIFGLYGVFFAMLTTNLIEKSARKALLTSIGVFVVYNLANGLKQGIDNAAHIGGLSCGLLIGYAYYPGLKQIITKKLQYITIAALTVFVLIASVVICSHISNDIGKYQSGMEQFEENEKNALALYDGIKTNASYNRLKMLALTGITDWNKNIQLVTALDKLQLPADFHNRNQIILNYCEMRIKSYNLLYKTFADNTDAYKTDIESYNDTIKNDINLLSK